MKRKVCPATIDNISSGKPRNSLMFCITVVALLACFGACDTNSITSDFPNLSVIQGETEYAEARRFQFNQMEAGGDVEVYTFTVSNYGRNSMMVSKVEYSDPGNFTFFSSSLPGEIEPESNVAFVISFHPRVAGEYRSKIAIYFEEIKKPFILNIIGLAVKK